MWFSHSHSHGNTYNFIKLRAVFIDLLNPKRGKKKNFFSLIKHLNLDIYKLWNDLFPFRLSSIDMKYHVWKLGVVFTDNVSMASGKVKSCAPKSRDVIRCHKETSYGGSPGRFGEFSWKTDSLRVWGDTSLSCNSIRQRGGDHLAILGSVHSPRWEKVGFMNAWKAAQFLPLPSPFSTSPGTRPCQSWATTTTFSSLLIFWISRWASRLWGLFCPLSLTMANRYGVYTGAEWEGPRYG